MPRTTRKKQCSRRYIDAQETVGSATPPSTFSNPPLSRRRTRRTHPRCRHSLLTKKQSPPRAICDCPGRARPNVVAGLFAAQTRRARTRSRLRLSPGLSRRRCILTLAFLPGARSSRNTPVRRWKRQRVPHPLRDAGITRWPRDEDQVLIVQEIVLTVPLFDEEAREF